MTQEFDAIYENGVLRPLVPLALKDQQLVHVSLEAPSLGGAEDPCDPELIAAQQRAWATFRERVEALPRLVLADATTDRDHDRLIYGG